MENEWLPDRNERARLGVVVVLAFVALVVAVGRCGVHRGPVCSSAEVRDALSSPELGVALLDVPSPLGFSARLRRCGVRARYQGREGDLIFSFREADVGVTVVLEGFDGALLPGARR